MEAACQMEADTAEQASGHGLAANKVPLPRRSHNDYQFPAQYNPGKQQWPCQDFTSAAGVTKGAAPTQFENERADQDQTNQPPWAPFETKKDQNKQIPEAGNFTGNKTDSMGHFKTEEVELWHRNPLECIVKLFSNSKFKGKQVYTPICVFRNADGTNCKYSEMWTSNWWWEIQELLEDGATVCPIIHGNKMAWPVNLSIGNIQKATRCQTTERAMVLIGYIPVTKLECFTKSQRSTQLYQLFYDCMNCLLKPLEAAGRTGVDMVCADSFIRQIFPMLAAYIAHYPEQCLVCCCKENTCPECAVKGQKRGEYLVHAMLRNVQATLAMLNAKTAGLAPPEFVDQNLCLVNPFWRNLSHCNIFSCMTSNLLYQLHKGVFHDHIVSWASEAMKGQQEEVDEQFQAMSLHPTLRHFKKGILLTSQYTGTKHKNMEKVFTDPQVILAVQGILNLIYYVHFKMHSNESLAKLDAAWFVFHQNKEVFERLEIREHFVISKVHNIKHYQDLIHSQGTADGFNTKGTERLHIDLAKMGYQAGNKKDYVSQMTVSLGWQEAVHQRVSYLQWAVLGYTAALVHKNEATGEPDNEGKGGLVLEKPKLLWVSLETPKTSKMQSHPGLAQN
ncbi:hypothetical protein B0H34DRAFT_678011 [Crassisporium funariophilum]|nr:hypothetical protein B0H34DRAFT_678011 [Crassisporium funariophilum]